MGAVISYLFCFNILKGNLPLDGIVGSRKVKVVAFHTLRVDNHTLAQLWSVLVQKYGVIKYSIRGYKDGETGLKCQIEFLLTTVYTSSVPTLPPQILRYHYISTSALYLAYGHLWSILQAQSEYLFVTFEPAAIRNLVDPFLFGGCNYYNRRDMELLQSMKWFGPYTNSDAWDHLKRQFEEQLQWSERTCMQDN